MSFVKYARIKFVDSSSLSEVIKASNLEDIILYNPKTAFIKHDVSKNLISANNSLDIVAELEDKNPNEWVIFRARAIDAGGSEKTGEIWHGANDNGDFFSEEELLTVFSKDASGKDIRSFETFINCPIFTNHQNDNIEKARGKIINAFYDKDNHCVYIDGLVDAKAYPELARGIKEGYISDVSMGSLSENSRVLMFDGSWKKHNELKIDDLVITHTGQIQPITMIFRSNEPIETYSIDFVGSDQEITASYDHPFFTIKKEECNCDYSWDNRTKCTPLGSVTNIACKKRDCNYSRNKELKNYTPIFIEAKDLKVGDYVLTPIQKWIGLENKNADLEFSTILGYYLSEGNKSPTTGLNFWFNINELEFQNDLINCLTSFCSRQKYNFRIQKNDNKNKNLTKIIIYCKELYNLICEFSSGTALHHDKKITNLDVYNWSKENKLNLIGKTINGDGCNKKSNRSDINGGGLKLYSNSEPLIDQFNNLCLSVGIISRKNSFLREKYSENSVVKSKPNSEYSLEIGNFDADKLQNYTSKHQLKTKTRTMLSNKRFIWNGYLCSPIKNINKNISTTKDFFYHIEVGGNEDEEINKLSDHTYIADGVAVHNCSVKCSTCSICGKEATSEKDYCSHVKNSKGKKIGGKEVYEINHGIKFIELSAVTDGACENCTIQSAYSGSEFLNKLEEMIRCSKYELSSIKAASIGSTIKTARGEDVDKLNKALDLLKDVAEQILSSKDVDFEFLEDIGKLLAELQNLIVDLVEAGFANQQQGKGIPTNPVGEEGEAQPPEAPEAPQGGAGPPPVPPAPAVPPTPGPVAKGNRNLKTSNQTEKDKKIQGLKQISQELLKLQGAIFNIKNDLSKGEDIMATSKQLKRIQATSKIADQFDKVLEAQVSTNAPVIITDGPYSVKIDFGKGVTGYVGKKAVASLPIEELGDETLQDAKENPSILAGRLIEKIAKKFNENGEVKMAGEKLDIKEALQTNPAPQDQVQEGQLKDLSGNWSRRNDPTEATGQVGVITQKQLEDVPTTPETGEGDWNRIRPEGIEENLQITEGQMEQVNRPTSWGSERKNPAEARAEGQHSQIQEGQFADKGLGYNSERWEDNMAPGDYLPITEGQFEGKDRWGYALDEVQEGQLMGHRQGPEYIKAKTASVADKVVNAVLNGMANAVLRERVSPKVVASTKITVANIQDDKTKNPLAPYIRSAIGKNMKIASSYLEDAISVLYEDKNYLTKKVSSYVDKKIEGIKKAASGEGVKTRAEMLREAFRKESERTAVSIDANVLAQLFPGVSDFTNLDEKMIKQKFLESKPGSKLLNFRRVDGGFIAEIETQREVGDINESAGMTGPINSDPINSGPMDSIQNEVSPTDSEIPVAAETIKKLKALAAKKEAQSPAGTTMPPPGGAPPAGGAPAPDMGAGAGNLAGPETGIDNEMAPDTLGEDDVEGTGEAKPFGAINPFTGNENVDVIDGHYRDVDTGLEWEAEVNINVLNPEKVKNIEFIENSAVEESEEEPEADGINDELATEPTGMEGAPNMGMGAPMASAPKWVKDAPLRLAMKVGPEMFMGSHLKTAYKNSGQRHYKLGQICPQCGSSKVAFKNSEGNCAACGCKTYVSANKTKGGKVKSELYMLPNIERSKKKNPWGGHAVSGSVESRREIEKSIHTILSQRKALLKAASIIDQDPWVACISDQVTSGYAGDDAIQVCSSIRDLAFGKTAQFKEDDDEKEEPKVHDDDDENNDNVEFEDESENESENESEDESEGEEIEDAFEDEDEDEGFEEIEESEIGDDVAELGAPISIKVTLEDAEGKTVELTADESGITVSEETVEDTDLMNDEPELLEDEGYDIGINEIVTDEEVEEDPLSSLFDNKAKFEDEEAEIDDMSMEPSTPQDILAKSLETSELLRGDRVASSNRGGGGSLNMDTLASALGMKKAQQTQPTRVPAKGVLRNKSVGIADEGGNVHTTKHDNTAMKRNQIADTSYNEKGIADGPERGVEQIKPKGGKFAGSADDFVVKKAEEGGACKLPKRKEQHPVSPTGGGERTSEEERMAKQWKSDKPSKEKKEAAMGCSYNSDEGDSSEDGEKSEKNTKSDDSKKRKEVFPDDFEPQADNGKRDTKGKKSETSTKKVAQSAPAKQTEPIDMGDGESNGEKFDAPRNKSKGKPQEFSGRSDVDSPKKVRKDNYNMGPGGKNLHTDVVPRDGSGDGVGGRSVTFEEEKAEGATSGNPDTYVQEFQESDYVYPTPYSSEDNHATSGPNTAANKAIQKIAQQEGIKDPSVLEAVDFGDFILIRDLSTGDTFKVE